MARTIPQRATIVLASDHAGFSLKQKIAAYLRTKGRIVLDFGAFDEQPADYPDYVIPACETIAKSATPMYGIVLGKSGIGESIAANKVKGIRASVCFDRETAKLTREHNHSNVLCLGAGTTAGKKWRAILDAWLSTPESNEKRHVRRLQKISAFEQQPMR